MTLLKKILKRTKADLAKRSLEMPISEIKKMVKSAPPPRPLLDAFRNGFGIIGEIKKESPSAGKMDPANVEKALEVYNNSSVIAAISVLTNRPFFGQDMETLKEVRTKTDKPIIRKDFIIDEYQVFEARAFGADGILLMASILYANPDQFAKLYALAKELGLQPFVELGMDKNDESLKKQIAMIPADIEMLGINSRLIDSWNIRAGLGRILGTDLITDRDRHKKIIKMLQNRRAKIMVAESGIKNPSEIKSLIDWGYNAALIGTTFLKGPNKVRETVHEFSEYVRNLGHSFVGSDSPALQKRYSHP